MSFAEPSALWLLAAPASAAVLAAYRHRRRVLQQRRLASPAVWRRLMGGTPATGLLRMLSWCVAGALVVLAMARPQWGELPMEQSVRTRDLVIAIDVSDSMLCPDLRPSRLARSLEVVMRALPGFEGNRVGVVVFAGDAYPLVPVTTDVNAVAAFLDGVRPQMVALPGSNLERAADAALRLLPDEGEGRVLVLVTDGENLQGDVAAAAERLRQAGVGVLAVVAGSVEGGPIPVPAANGSVQYKRDSSGQPVVTRARPEVLHELADSVDGEVLQLTGGRVVQELIEKVDRLRTRETEATQTVQRIERFPIFLIAAVAVLGLGFVLSPWRRMATVAVLAATAIAAPAAAQDADPVVSTNGARTTASEAAPPTVPWWQRLIPGGSRRLARAGAGHWRDQDIGPAAEDFAGAVILDPDNPDRLYDAGTALAAGGDLESATGLLARAHEGGSAAAAYNVGTASLAQQQAEPAVQWLRRALVSNPDDPDAKRNYELALQLQQQQQQQQQQQEQQEDQQQSGDQEQPQPQATPTPTPSQSPAGPPPTPTPDLSEALFAALDREEAEAREQMRSPTPQAIKVERDW